MIRWPVAYVINFKTKHVDVKIPIRVKLIERKIFTCDKCRYARKEKEVKSIKEFNNDKREGYYCSQHEIKLTESIQKIIKLYAKKIKYIDMGRVLNSASMSRWFETRFFPSNEVFLIDDYSLDNLQKMPEETLSNLLKKDFLRGRDKTTKQDDKNTNKYKLLLLSEKKQKHIEVGSIEFFDFDLSLLNTNVEKNKQEKIARKLIGLKYPWEFED